MPKRDPRKNPQPGDCFENHNAPHYVFVITPVLLQSKADPNDPAVFINDIYRRKPAHRLLEMEEFRDLVRKLKIDPDLLTKNEKPIAPLQLPKACALEMLTTGRRPAKVTDGTSELIDLIPIWLTSARSELRIYAAKLVAKRPKAEDVPALRSLIVRSGSQNDHPAKLACDALAKLGRHAVDAVPELLRAAESFISHGCPQRFDHAAPALLKIAPPPAKLVDICVKHLKVSNYGILKCAVETLIAISSPAARKALRQIDKLRNKTVQGKPVDKLLQRIRNLK